MTTYRDRLAASSSRPDVPLRPFRTPVRGHPFAASPPGAGRPRTGQPAALHREPDNPADPLAVAVWTEGAGQWWRLGYLDRGVAARVAGRMDRGVTIDARLDGWVAEPDGRWQRPVVLLLPASSPRSPRPGAPAPATAGESGPATALWGRPPGVIVRPVRSRDRG